MTPYSLAWTLDRIRPRLPPRIVPAAEWRKLRALAEHLPAAITTCIYFESWLYGGLARLDFTIRVLDGGPARWLEFDIGEASWNACLAGTVAARVFVDAGAHVPAQTIVEMLEGLRGRSLHPVVRRRLQIACDARPARATIQYVGFSQHLAAARVCVAGLEGEQLTAYLRGVGWTGEIEPLAELVNAIGVRFGLVHFDVGPDGRPAIGLEYPAAAVFPYLVEHGFCDSATRDDLLAWPGHSIEPFPHHLWCSRLLRRLNHVKVVCEGGRVRAVKAYLCCLDRPLAGGVASARLANRASRLAARLYSVEPALVSADDRERRHAS